MKKLLNNYHTHTTYCRHSSNKLEELIQYAIDQGYQILGISEHCPYPPPNFTRNPKIEELDQLIKEFKEMKQKYSQKIELHFGLETEYCKERNEYYQNLKKREGIEYFIFGNHSYKDSVFYDEMEEFIDLNTIDALEVYVKQTRDAFASGLFSAMAHPDLFLKGYHQWDEHALKATNTIINLSIEYDVPLGLNGNGLLYKRDEFYYPSDYFWKEVSKSKAKVIIETDAHELKVMSQEHNQKLFDYADRLNLNKNIINKLTLK